MLEPKYYSRLTRQERRLLRLDYIIDQKGLCMYCATSLEGPPNPEIEAKPINWRLFPGGIKFLDNPIHLQHNHYTDLTEGAVHAKCNAVMWEYEGR